MSEEGGAFSRARDRPRPFDLELSVPSDTAFLGLVRDVTSRLAEISGFDRSTAEGLALAVDECSTNVIQHAYGGAPERRFRLRYAHDDETFTVEVADSGARVRPEAVPDVDLRRYARERRKGGLGVHLMAKIMDSVAYTRTGGRNVCCMSKRRHREPGGKR